MGKLSKDKRDIYYRLAKQNDYRSRSAFKLLQVESEFHLLENSRIIVDLCAAPGGFSQICSQFTKSKKDAKIISVDLQEISPIENVCILMGDITNQDTLTKIMELSNDQKIDLVLCDGAPDVTGFNEFDVYVQSQLVLTALNTSIRMLKEGGNFITKLFKGKYTEKIIKIFLSCFEKVTITKPKACRNASFESFIVCEGFNILHKDIKYLHDNKLKENDMIILNNIDLFQHPKYINFCKDIFSYDLFNVNCIQVGLEEFDSDKSYDLSVTNYKKVLNPVQMPINPPYKNYLKTFKDK